MKHVKSESSFLAMAGLVAVSATIGLSACGKFEIDPKLKGVSTNSNPLKAEAEDKVRSLVSASPAPSPSPRTREADRGRRTGETGDAALDQVRRLFDEELSAPGAPAALAPAPASATAAAPAAAPAPAEQAPDTAAAPAAPAPVEQATAALIAQELSDEAKGQLLFELVEPTMRINFRISLQRNEILAMKRILDDKKELSKEQQEKLAHFKRSFLVPGDSIEALLSRVDVIAFTIQVAPLLLETNWGTKGKITAEALSNRSQKLNTHPTDDAVRFRSGRLALQGSNRTDISRQVYAAELGYNPEEGKIESLEPLRLTQMEVERVMRSPGISTMLDNQIKKMTAQMIQEFSK